MENIVDGAGKHRPDKAYAFTPDETMAFWGMKKRYHSFDVPGVHFPSLNDFDRSSRPSKSPPRRHKRLSFFDYIEVTFHYSISAFFLS
jgi:hypothetical protein